MKPDYTALGNASLARLRTACENADEIQNELLSEIVINNKNTEFGKKYNFSAIKSTEDFQNTVPLSCHDDYCDYIDRIINGGKNILTAEYPVYFCVSSGTTGEEKFFPVTEEDIMLQHIYACGAIYGQVMEYYRGFDERELFGKIFQIGEFAKTSMPDGRMNGIRSGCVYQWLNKDGEFDASDYCVPKEILFPETLEDLLYIKVRFALAERNLTAIHGVFINRIAGVMDYIYRNWDMLIFDMEHGTVNKTVSLSKKWRGFIEERLKRGMIKKLWKNVKYILAIGGDAFSCYNEKMAEFADGIPVHHYAYAASEGIFGIAETIDVPDRYILIPESVFFEFIPINKNDPERPLLMREINIGEKYELVLTNRSGLYRYRLGDVIEVVGRYKNAPVVKYCYRLNQAINIAGEKTNCEQLSAAVKRFSEITGARIIGYCVTEDVSGIAPRYLIYIECADSGVIQNAGKILEKCMREANFDYRSCAEINEIAPLRAEFLKSGSFSKYERKLAESGRLMGQNKLLHFLDTEEKKEFFAAQVIKKEIEQ